MEFTDEELQVVLEGLRFINLYHVATSVEGLMHPKAVIARDLITKLVKASI
jgi:hypothetical protein